MELGPQVNVASHAPASLSFRALRHRDYRLYWVALTVSLTGVAFQTVAQNWLVYRLTGSALMLGVAGFIPAVLAAPASLLGGAIADRVSRRNLVIVTQSMMVIPPIMLALLIFTSRVQVWHVIVASAALGIVAAIDLPSRTAMIPNLVGKDDVLNAQGLASASRHVTQIIGPALAGMLIAAAGEAACFLVNGLSYLAMVVAYILMKPQPVPTADRRRGIGGALLDGFRYTWTHPIILGLFAVLAAQGLFLSPIVMILPVFAKDVLNIGAAGLGWLQATIGLGAVVGALVVAGLRAGRRGRFMMAGSAVMPLALVAFAWSTHLATSLPFLAVMGFGTVAITAIAASMLLILVPDEVRGRVNSLGMMVFLGAPYTGGLLIGFAAEQVGAPATLTASAILFVFSLGLINLKWPMVRRIA